jgi:VanZ family protein
MTIIRANAWLAILIIIILSVVPGNLRPHVMGSSDYEHFTAYFITGSLLAIGYSRPVQLLAIVAMLATSAGALEVLQFSIPGRTASVGDFAAGTIGAWIGVLVVVLVRWVRDGTTAVPLSK